MLLKFATKTELLRPPKADRHQTMLPVPQSTKNTILIVDDSTQNLQLLGNVLRNDGYEIAFSQSGEHTLSIVETILPDLILLDIMMPGCDGYTVCETIKKNPKINHIPIIFISAKSEVDDLVKGFELGAVDYITKPFQSRELRSRVNTHIALKKANDVIQQQKTELELLNQEKLHIFSIIAHDLKSPFNSLLNLMYLVNTYPKENFPSKIYQFLQETEKSAKTLYGLLENLLQWASLQMGRFNLEFRDFSPQEIIEQGNELFLSMAAHKNIKLIWQGNFDLHVHANFDALYTIIRNILSNAIKFSPPEEEIIISSHSKTNTMVINIQDRGVGMDTEQLAALFHLQVKNPTIGTIGEKGSGLGLLLCHELAQKSNLKIEVSSAPQEGCCFSIHIPFSK